MKYIDNRILQTLREFSADFLNNPSNSAGSVCASGLVGNKTQNPFNESKIVQNPKEIDEFGVKGAAVGVEFQKKNTFGFSSTIEELLIERMSMTENENQDASSKKRFKTCDNNDSQQWSNLNQDILFLVMMQLGYFDFPAFGGVCKSWRSFAVSNKNKFMESRPTMSLSVPKESKEEDYYCYLEDIEERCFISILPHSGGRMCVGFTCDHLILFGKESNDFWLLNPFTRHGVHFPDIPSLVSVDDPKKIRGVLVFSPLNSKWLFAMTYRTTNIWYSIAGEGTWNHVSSPSPIADVDALNGKIYAIDNARHFYELTLDPEPKLMVLETKNFPNSSLVQWLVRLEESLYLQEDLSESSYKIYELDFEEMNWVLISWIKKHWPCIHNRLRHNAAVKHGKGKVSVWMINR